MILFAVLSSWCTHCESWPVSRLCLGHYSVWI